MEHTRIMLVEDDPGSGAVLQKLLCAEGFDVDLAESASGALRMVREGPPDVVLTDLKMPEMDGITLCGALHESNPELPIIVVTGFADTGSVVAALHAGADDYVVKPVDFDAMLVKIRSAIERRAAKREQLRPGAGAETPGESAVGAGRAHDDVLSIVSHELKNPLAVILMRVQQLTALALPGEQERDVQAIAASIFRNAAWMKHLVADLLDEASVSSGHLRLQIDAQSLTQLLSDVAEVRPLAYQKRIRLDIRMPERELTVRCDRIRMMQVLGNLVVNAVKFSPCDSTVAVFAEEADRGVRFAVRDEGPGIAAEDLPKLFERFWQSRGGARMGVGLGLYIAKGIVEAHGGRIWVESKLGGGSTFYVFIPESSAGARRVSSAHAEPEPSV